MNINTINLSAASRRFSRPTTSAVTINPTNGKTCTDPRGPVGGPYGPPVGPPLDPEGDGNPQPIIRGEDDRKAAEKDGWGDFWLAMVERSPITYGYRSGKGWFPA